LKIPNTGTLIKAFGIAFLTYLALRLLLRRREGINLMANGPRDFLVPLLSSEIFDAVPTRGDLENEVRKSHWQTLATQIVGILCVSWQDGIEEVSHQRRLIVAMMGGLPYRKKVADILQSNPHRRVFTREALVAVLRVAVAEGSEGNGEPAEQPDSFTKAVLIANELLATEIMLEEITNGPKDLLPTELRSAILQLENPHDLLGRSDALFEWALTDKARASENYSDVAADFMRFTGLTPFEFMSGAYFMFARYSSMVDWDTVEKTLIPFSIAQWQAGMSDQRVIRQWIVSNTVSLEDVRKEWKAQKSLSFAAAGSIWTKPIVQVEGDLYFAPVPALVGNTMGDGTYFVLFDGYRDEAGDDSAARKRAIAKFTGFYGEFFEDHIASIFEKAYDNKPGRRFTREVYIRPGDLSSDVIVAEGDDVLFIEIVSKRMNLRESVLKLKPAAIAKDIEDGVLHKAQQLHDNIEAYRSGELLPEWPRKPGQRFFPIIVAPHDRPRINVITTDLEAKQESGGLLAGSEPLELLDLGEVEQLEDGLDAGISLAELLTRKNHSGPVNRLSSLHNYLYYVERDLLPAGMSPTRKRGGDVAKRIMEEAKTRVEGYVPEDPA
jgi:hypothetical protein